MGSEIAADGTGLTGDRGETGAIEEFEMLVVTLVERGEAPVWISCPFGDPLVR